MLASRIKSEPKFLKRQLYVDRHILDASPTLLFLLLSGCGGGGSSKAPPSTTDDLYPQIPPDDPSVAKIGKVVDGYVAGSKVFYDLNKNYQQENNEEYTITNLTGDYSLSVTLNSDRLVANHNNYTAIDTAHGMSFSITLSAPGNYSTITPVSSIVQNLVERGYALELAETIVKEALLVDPVIDLSTLDPYASVNTTAALSVNSKSSEDLLMANMKIANILTLSDDNIDTENLSISQLVLEKLSNKLISDHTNNRTTDLSSLSTLEEILPVTNKSITHLREINSGSNYADLLDNQIRTLAGYLERGITLNLNNNETLLAFELGNTINQSDFLKITLLNAMTGASISSSDVIALGGKTAVFSFSTTKLAQLGAGEISAKIQNLSTSQYLDVVNDFSISASGFNTPSHEETPRFIQTDSGVVADGYISNARVFRDENANKSFDVGEEFVTTDGDGKFEGLEGDPTKAIVVDGNDGAAVDTSTGVTFNAVLSAPAGSKVVNPITTIVNELLLDPTSGATSVSQANALVAKTFGLSEVKKDGALVDFTKFDPISNKIFNDDETESSVTDTKLATLTQGVATYVANLVVAGANEKGGDVATLASTTKSIISNIKDLVKSNQSSSINFSDETVILQALGSDFKSSSTTLEKMKTDFKDFDPTNLTAIESKFSQEKLIEKQLVAQSEFGDGVLTTSEASNGALLVLGPTYDPNNTSSQKEYNGSATVKLTNETSSKVIFKTIKYGNSKYASVEYSSSELNDTLGGGVLFAEVKPGTLTSSTWDGGGLRIYDNSSSKLYFHKDIVPEVVFDSSTVVTVLSNGAATVKASDTAFTISGKIKIDIGSASLPTGITLRHLVDGLDTEFDGTGRQITLEFLNSAGEIKFVLKTNIEPVLGASDPTATTGSSTFNWSKSFDNNTTSEYDSDVKFSDLTDGSYSIRASFIDAYGAVTKASDSLFSNLTFDRNPPQVLGKISASDTKINAADSSATFTIELTEAVASLDTTKIKFDVNSAESTLAAEISAGKASTSFNADNKKLTVSYTPTQTGTINLEVLPGAFLDAVGNLSTSNTKTSSADANEISFDFVAPTVTVSIVNASKTFNPASETLNLVSETGLKTKFTFSEAIQSFSLDDVTISSISGTKAGSLVLLTGNEQTTDNITWYAGLDLTADLAGALSVSVAGNSYTDLFGNLGSAGSVTIQQDTDPASVFQVALKSDTEKATYGYGDAVYIIVTFDSEISSVTGAPVIELTIGGVTRNASFVKIDESDATKVHFTYSITKASGDKSDSNGIVVANSISGGTLVGTDGNLASLDLSTASQPLDLSGKVVDAGTDGSAVDGYVEGAIIYADNDSSGDLSAGDPIAQANATGGFAIYGAAGPLVLEGGFDISTNKDFNVRYKAPGDADITYTVINPITTLINQINSGSLTTAEAAVRTAMGNPLSSADKLRTYNAYEAIAEAGDAATDTDAVRDVVLDALKYQKAAASVALVTDFLSSASYYVLGSPSTTSIQKISDDVFVIIGDNLSTFMQLFVGQTFSSYYDSGDARLSIDNNASAIKSGLETLFGSMSGISNLTSDFTETFDVLATAISAINSVQFTAPANSSSTDAIIALAEEGINALTEIVQVQTVIQTNFLSELSGYYVSNKEIAAPTISVDRLLGTSVDTGYLSTPVGTVVPIRYSIELPVNKTDSSANAVQFEADENGIAASYEFIITRSGSIKTNSQLNYEIQGSVSADDIVGGALEGSLFFDVNEKTKTLKVALNNDSNREATETLTVLISDPTGTSQIVEERASATVKDDDPSTPGLSLPRVFYALSEDGEVFIDDANVDYFDQNASFSVSWSSDGGTLSTTVDGSAYTQGTYVSYYDLQTDLLKNLKFTADTQSSDSKSGAALMSITAAQNADGTGRSASSELQLTFDVARKPSLDISNISFDAATSYAGVPMKITGITVSDADSEYLTVIISSTLKGTISATSQADFTVNKQGENAVAISGTVTNVQDALSNLTFLAEKAGEVKFTMTVDDADQFHARDPASGLLTNTATQTRLGTTVAAETSAHTINASAPSFKQVFEPNIKVGSGFWNGFTGIEVSDIDSETVTVMVSSALDASNGNTPKVNFRFFDNSNPAAPLTIDKSNNFTITGSPKYVTDQLKLLQVEMLVNEQDLVTFSVYDGEAVTIDNKIQLTPSYVAMDNAVPDPGGDVEFIGAILEDSGEAQISFSGIRLYDSDALEGGILVAPKFIRILSSEGGIVKTTAGESIVDANGTSIDIPVNNGSLSIRFQPNKDFNGQGIIKYVVVDPQQSNFTSPISELSITISPVNDKPELSISNIPAVYIQGQDPVSIFQSVNLTDVDSNSFTEIKISSDLDLSKGDLPLITPDGMFGLTKTQLGNEITFDGVSISTADVSSFLSSIRFQSTSNNLVNQTRNVTITVKDDQGLESEVVSKSIIMNDLNDGPEILNGKSTVTFTEDDQLGIALSEFGSVVDPEGNNIAKLVSNITAGYKLGQDTFSHSSALNGVVVEFDTASGALSVTAADENIGISASDLNTVLSQITYKNLSQNPDSNVKKTIIFEITDILGETSLSNANIINIQAINDKPELISIVGDQEVTTAAGPQFVQGGGAVRVAPTVKLRDVDGTNFKSATIELNTNHGGVLSVTSSGEKLAQALGLTTEIISASKILVYKTAPNDTNFMNLANLESILREISYSNAGNSLDGKIASVNYSVIDSANAQSDQYTSTIKLLDQPSVDVKLQAIADDTNFSSTTDKNSDETANVLTFNSTFSANLLHVDLSASAIRTETGRFKYDPSITALKLPLNQAGHLDLRNLSGSEGITNTKIIGQSNSDIFYGSKFIDFIDGNGGVDVIIAGEGNDTVALRIDSSGSLFDGGSGVDTLILPQTFSGTLNLGSATEGTITITKDSKSVSVSNFENVDARSVNNAINLKGDSNNNQLLGGKSDDVIWLTGGADIASGGDGADLYVIDIGSISASGSKIIDITAADKIKFVNGDETYLTTSQLNWIYGSDAAAKAAAAATQDIWISQEAEGFYLNVEVGSTVKRIDLGSEIYGAPGKWIHTDGTDFTLQPEQNVRPKFDATKPGPATSENKPIKLTGTTGNYSLTLASGNSLAVVDSDGDSLKLSLGFSGATISLEGTSISDGFEKSYASPTALNTALGTLSIKGTERGAGNLTLSVTDTYSTPITKKIFFEVPNSAPTISIGNFNKNSPPKTEILTPIKLSDVGVTFSIGDVDTLDISSRELDVIVNVTGATAVYNGDFKNFVEVSGNNVLIKYDGLTSVSGGGDWTDVLEKILGEIEFSNATVGRGELKISVSDAGGLSDNLGSDPILIDFQAKPLLRPELKASTQNLETLNGPQFDTAKVRVFLKDVGARVGDQIVIKTKIGTSSQADVTKTIGASLNDPDSVVAYIDVPLSELVSGASKDGSFSVTAELKINGAKASATIEAATFSVDTQGASTPQIVGLNDKQAGGEITSENVTEVIVENSESETGLSHSLVQILASSDGAWYTFSNSFNLKSALLGSGLYQGEIIPLQELYDPVTKKYQLRFDDKLEDGVYAVISRDAVGNVSTFDVSSFDFATKTLPDGLFIVDRELDPTSFVYDLVNATEIPGENFKEYSLSFAQTESLELAVTGTQLGRQIAEDVVKITVQIWENETDLGSTATPAKINSTFTRDLTATENHWVLDSGANVRVSDSSSKLKPIFEIALSEAMPNVSGNIGLRLILEDVAGNTAEIDSPTGQILLDVTADEIVSGAVNDGKITSLIADEDYQGVSVPDSKSVDITISGIDDDIDTRSTYFLNTEQIEANLKNSADGSDFSGKFTDLTMDTTLFKSGSGQLLPKFTLGESTGAVYLDLENAFLQSLKLKSDGVSVPPVLGDVADWKYIATSDGKAEYILASEYNKFVTIDGYSTSIYTSNMVVNTHVEGQYLTSLSEVTQDITAMLPAENSPDQPLYIFNQVKDLAGNIAFSSDVLPKSDLEAAVSQSILIDVTPPSAPTVFIERVNGGIDFWEASENIRFTINETDAGDILLYDTVKFNGNSVSYDSQSGYFSFDIPSDLVSGTYNVTQELQDNRGNLKTFSQEVNLTRAASADFAVVPKMFLSEGNYFAEFDIYLNTQLDKFDTARSVDVAFIPPKLDFDYISTTVNEDLSLHAVNEVNPELIWFTGVNFDGFKSSRDPLFSIKSDLKASNFDGAAITDTLEFKLILVDEIAVSDFTYSVDFDDILITETLT